MDFNDFRKMKNKKKPDLENSWNQSSTNSQEDEDIDEEELNSINNQLDQLNNALDELEQKNDNIQSQLVQLLESNRQARKQFQQMQNQSSSSEQKEQFLAYCSQKYSTLHTVCQRPENDSDHLNN